MQVSKRVLVWAYVARPFRFLFTAGAEHGSDPDTFTLWVYLGLFGFALSWCRDGWLYPADMATALAVLEAAPDPTVQTPIFLDEWDRLEREDTAAAASAARRQREKERYG
jgi:hypothetical protein